MHQPQEYKHVGVSVPSHLQFPTIPARCRSVRSHVAIPPSVLIPCVIVCGLLFDAWSSRTTTNLYWSSSRYINKSWKTMQHSAIETLPRQGFIMDYNGLQLIVWYQHSESGRPVCSGTMRYNLQPRNHRVIIGCRTFHDLLVYTDGSVSVVAQKYRVPSSSVWA